jgi:hypothetical protein
LTREAECAIIQKGGEKVILALIIGLIAKSIADAFYSVVQDADKY